MMVSDLLADSVHALLYRIFCSEIGLASVAHPAVYYHAMAENFESLRSRLLTGEETYEIEFFSKAGISLAKVAVPLRQEAQLFANLYKSPYMKRAAEGEESLLMNRHVFPLIGQTIEELPEMRQAILAQLEEHIRHFGRPVGERILGALPAFQLQRLAFDLRNRLEHELSKT